MHKTDHRTELGAQVVASEAQEGEEVSFYSSVIPPVENSSRDLYPSTMFIFLLCLFLFHYINLQWHKALIWCVKLNLVSSLSSCTRRQGWSRRNSWCKVSSNSGRIGCRVGCLREQSAKIACHLYQQVYIFELAFFLFLSEVIISLPSSIIQQYLTVHLCHLINFEACLYR